MTHPIVSAEAANLVNVALNRYLKPDGQIAHDALMAFIANIEARVVEQAAVILHIGTTSVRRLERIEDLEERLAAIDAALEQETTRTKS